MGADPNAVVDGYTSLFVAGVEGHTDAIKVLIARGADIDDSSSRALLCFRLKSIVDVANALLGGGSREGLENTTTCERLTLAIEEGGVRMVQVLLASDVQVDKATNDGMTSLHGASMHGKIGTCTNSLAKNASVNIKNQTGDTPLYLAVSNDHFGAVQALISAGAIVNVVNHTAGMPLIVAARHSYLEAAQALLTAGARVEMVNKSGELAIVAVTRCDHISIVKKLLAASANVRALASDIDGLLVAADGWGHPITASLLLERAELFFIEEIRGLAQDLAHMTDLSPRFIPPQELKCEFPKVDLVCDHSRHQLWSDKWRNASVVIYEWNRGRDLLARHIDKWYELTHPSVVKIFGASHQHSPSLIVFKNTLSTNLREYLSENRHLVWQKLLDVALGLKYLHERGIFLGKLSCENVWIGADGLAKLAKCALSTAAGSSLNSLYWQAPEVLMHGLQAEASDVYSLGMCIYEASTGCVPWQGNSTEEASRYAERGLLSLRRERLSDSQWGLVESMCHLDPAKRVPLPIVIEHLKEFVSTVEANKIIAADDGEIKTRLYDAGRND